MAADGDGRPANEGGRYKDGGKRRGAAWMEKNEADVSRERAKERKKWQREGQRERAREERRRTRPTTLSYRKDCN